MDNSAFKEFLKEKRENLSNSSINTYSSILRSLYKKVFGDGPIEPKKFDQSKTIINHLQDMPANKRKTILSALVIVSGKKEYRDLMMDDINTYKKDMSKQEKSETQEENWLTQEEIESKLKELAKIAGPLMMKEPSSLSNAEIQKIQNYIILALLSGVFINVRRSKDYVDFKIRNVDEDKDNYISKDFKTLNFNSYKTSKAYGKQTLKLPTKLRNILKKWIQINKSDYLLVDSSGNPLGNPHSSSGSVKLNQRLQKIFGGKKSGVNILRHSILSSKYKDVAEDMKEMGSSTSQLINYVKKD
jgi:integrase